MKNWLFKGIDNSALIVFRMVFGLLITLESWGAIFTGWVHRTLIEPQFTFNFIGFEFLQPLPGNGMYYYFVIMGLCGVFVMLGLRYRLSMVAFTVLWAGVYLMQKTSYNNHYYLLFLLNILMCFLPAHRDVSLDCKKGYVTKSRQMPNWCRILIIVQLFLVYTYAAIAKCYPDWLNTTVAANLMKGRQHFFLIGDLLQQPWVHYILTYAGIFFDLLIIPALLFKPTRKLAFITAVFFHLFNSFVLHIGIFPYLALGFTLFFFESKKIRKWFYPTSQKYIEEPKNVFAYSKAVVMLTTLWLIVQLVLPLRHWFIPGDVLWTEEGHRLSWRMMLRSKSGTNIFYIVDPQSGSKTRVAMKNYLTRKQIRSMTGKPDMIWQFAQKLKEIYAADGKTIEVYVKNRTRVNGSQSRPLINPQTNLAEVDWNYWGHNDWILIE